MHIPKRWRESFGSCRLCLVEIEGKRGYPASCTTPVEQDLKVHTQTPKLADIRKGEYEGMAEKLKIKHWKPDYGPSKLNIKSGVTAIGVR